MPRKSRFKIVWWKWYLVDVKDWHKPIMVRRFFENPTDAKNYANNYLGENFEILRGFEALELGVRDYINKNKKYRYKLSKTTKYQYPPHIKTSYEKKFYRIYNQHKRKRMKHIEPITRKELFHMLLRKPIGFAIRTKSFRNYHWAYSKPSENLKKYIKAVNWPKYVRVLTVIEKTLIKYGYDIGPWPLYHVVIRLYEEYGSTILKLSEPIFIEHSQKNSLKVKSELRARGFVLLNSVKPNNLPENCYITEKSGLGWFLVYPEWCRLTIPINKDDKRPYVYDFQDLVGIPGYTRAKIPDRYIS